MPSPMWNGVVWLDNAEADGWRGGQRRWGGQGSTPRGTWAPELGWGLDRVAWERLRREAWLTHGQNDPLLATTKEIGPQAATPRAADVLKTLGHDQAYSL
jgi:hypothetical protein